MGLRVRNRTKTFHVKHFGTIGTTPDELFRWFERGFRGREDPWCGGRHFDMALMELREARTMADRDDRRCGKYFGKGLVDLGFHGFVHRRGRLVEEEPIGLRQYGAGDREALLLASRKPLLPNSFDIELGDEVT